MILAPLSGCCHPFLGVGNPDGCVSVLCATAWPLAKYHCFAVCLQAAILLPVSILLSGAIYPPRRVSGYWVPSFFQYHEQFRRSWEARTSRQLNVFSFNETGLVCLLQIPIPPCLSGFSCGLSAGHMLRGAITHLVGVGP